MRIEDWGKSVKEENPNFHCKYCGSDNLRYKIDDGDHEDINYWCPDCNKSWWVDGCDS